MDYQDKIDTYLLGQMTPLEETLFLQECKSNPVLKEQAIATAYLVKALRKTHDETSKD